MTEGAAQIAGDAVPCLPRGVRLHEDRVRGKTVLLAPERVLDLDPVGLAILGQIDGQRNMRAIIDSLAELYDAPAERIAGDVQDYIGGLLDRRILEISP
ncbi:pyrroloquinoline quinone biosynthesis peptide chaperone PqqD [Roseovarius aquimarinus]|uniref:Pyrroloquinoline quinone biosynthesis peptide chaperone PqqD n=1 Tax=Roseovarius aquimarinus TaxID=1229156 RepID=A0ABW7I5E1_9RHOB